MESQYESTSIAGVDPCKCNRAQMNLIRQLMEMAETRREDPGMRLKPEMDKLLERLASYEEDCVVKTPAAKKIIKDLRERQLGERIPADEFDEYIRVFMLEEDPFCGWKF